MIHSEKACKDPETTFASIISNCCDAILETVHLKSFRKKNSIQEPGKSFRVPYASDAGEGRLRLVQLWSLRFSTRKVHAASFRAAFTAASGMQSMETKGIANPASRMPQYESIK
jgi:hypothetical protein